MCDSRAFIKTMDLETIEEEDADFLSQHSRNNLRNGKRGGGQQQSRPHSQTNTITTYDTQHTDFFDSNSLAYLNVNNGGGGGSVRNSLFKPAVASGKNGIRASSSKSADKWDRNYYYNDYDPRDPFGLYLATNSKTSQKGRKREEIRMAKCVSWIWCGSSLRYFILMLSFLALASLFANLQLFNIVALYSERELLPPLLRREFAVSQPTVLPGALRWSSTTENEAEETIYENFSKEDIIVRQRLEGFNESDTPKKSSSKIPAKNTSKTQTNTIEWLGHEPKHREGRDLHRTYGRKDAPKNNASKGNEQGIQPTGMNERSLIEQFIQSIVFSIPGLAILIGHFPSVLLIRRFGAHKVIFGALLLSSATTAVFPFIIGSSSIYIILLRTLLGLSFAPSFAFIGSNADKWATVNEQLFFILVGLLAVQFGPILSWFGVVNLLNVDQHSRIRLFGLHSAISTLLAIIWLLFYRDRPQKYKLVNGEELTKILKGKPVRNRRPNLPQSLRCMLVRSTSAWACWMAAFCYFFAQLSLHIFLPVFIYKVLRHSIDITIVVPFILLVVTHLFVHMLGPCFGSTSTWKVRIFNSTGFLLSALIFLGITIIPRDHQYEFRCVLLLWLCLLPLGFCSAGFLKSAVVCGRFFTRYIVAHMQFAFGLAYFLVPTLVFMVISESSIVHWRLLFLSNALILLLGLAIFVILGRGTATRWAEEWAEKAKAEDSLLMVKFTKTPFE